MPQYLSILFQTSDEGLPERLVMIKDSGSPRIIRSGHFLSKESIVHWVHGDYHLAERLVMSPLPKNVLLSRA